MSTLIGKFAMDKKTGETGTITKVIGNCLWVRMDDGTELSGGKTYWKVTDATELSSKTSWKVPK